MARNWIELVTGPLEEKKQYREYTARIKQLPANYCAAAEAVERYLMYAGGIAKGDVLVRMYGDLVGLFEESAANGTPVRGIVGDDPIEVGLHPRRQGLLGGWFSHGRAPS